MNGCWSLVLEYKIDKLDCSKQCCSYILIVHVAATIGISSGHRLSLQIYGRTREARQATCLQNCCKELLEKNRRMTSLETPCWSYVVSTCQQVCPGYFSFYLARSLYEVLSFQVASKAGSWRAVDDSTVDHSFQHGNLLLQVFDTQNIILFRCIDVNHILGNVAPRVIDLLDNIQICLCEYFGNVSEHTRQVLVHHSESNSSLWVFQFRFREVDAVSDSACLEKLTNRIGSHGSLWT